MDLDYLKGLIGLFEGSSLAEMEVESDGRRVRLTKPSALPAPVQHIMAPMHAMPAPHPGHAAPGAPGAPAAPVEPEAPAAFTIDSPMVGTYYSAGSPGDPPYVTVGSTVQPGATVCIIEAMKIMNEVTAERACVIEKLLVENEQPVEFGQPLFEVRYL